MEDNVVSRDRYILCLFMKHFLLIIEKLCILVCRDDVS